MPAIQPSPALVVSSDTRIDECVKKMRDHNVGSLLVLSYAKPYSLIGIFTERDLLKHFTELQEGGHWGKSIALVMHKPVITVGITDLDRAAEIMLEHRFRHLPVVYEDERGETHVAGVISMRDLFKHLTEEKVASLKLPRKKLKIGVLVGKTDRYEPLSNVFVTQDRATVTRMAPDRAESEAGRFDFVFVDIDGFTANRWSTVLKDLGQAEGKVKVFVVYNPAEHKPETVAWLKKLAQSERFAPFAKPVNILEVLGQLNRWRGRG